MRVQFGKRQRKATAIFLSLAIMVTGSWLGYAGYVVDESSAAPYFRPGDSFVIDDEGVGDTAGRTTAMTVGGDGLIYVAYASTVDRFIFKLDANGGRLAAIQPEKCDDEAFTPGDITALEVDAQGTIYAAQTHNASSGGACVQKYGAQGVIDEAFSIRVPGTATITSMTLGDNGRIYVSDWVNGQIHVYESNGAFVLTFGGVGENNGQFRENESIAVDYYDGKLYALGRGTTKLQVFSSTGSYLSGFQIWSISSASMIKVDAGGVHVSGMGVLMTHNATTGAQVREYRIQDSQRVDIFDFTEDAMVLVKADTPSLHLDVYNKIDLPPPLAGSAEVLAVAEDGSGAIRVMRNENDPNADLADSYYVDITYGGATFGGGSGPLQNGTADIAFSGLTPGLEYQYAVFIRSPGGSSPAVTGSFTVPGTPPPAKMITGVEFGDLGQERTLIVNGQSYYQSMAQLNGVMTGEDLVTLNGNGLPACFDNLSLAYGTLEQLKSYYPNANVSNDRPCYLYVDAQFTPQLTPTRVSVILPSDFDETAPGSVSVLGSATYYFNGVQNPPVEEPSAALPGGVPLSGNPTIGAKPTFSGRALAGTQVRLTIYSDPVTCSTTADSNGNWSCTFGQALPAGAHTLYIRYVEPGEDGRTIDQGPFPVTVAADQATSGGESSGSGSPVTGTAGRSNGGSRLAQVNPDGTIEPIENETEEAVENPTTTPISDAAEEAQATDVVESAPSLAWVWWTIGGIVLLGIIIAAVAGAQKKTT